MNDIAHVIQLAVAPVFLLAGIGAFVNAFAVRLGRVFDRIRTLERDYGAAPGERRASARVELQSLWRRARLTYYGIALTVLSAFLVCVLVTVAFLAYFLQFESRLAIGGLFMVAMLALLGALLIFLREVFVAVSQLKMTLPANVPSSDKPL